MTVEYPEEKTPDVSPLPREAQLQRFEDRSGEVRRLLALRRRLPGRLHPRARGGQRPGAPGLDWRALRRRLRDQHDPLHLLRLLRGRVPVRRDPLFLDYELADFDRSDLVFTKEMLLAPHPERTPLRRRRRSREDR